MRLPSWLNQHLTAVRTLLLLTVLTGLLYPLAVTAVAQVPGLRHRADASLLDVDGRTVGSSLIGQQYLDRTATRCGSTSSHGHPRPGPATTRPRPAPPTSGRRASSTSSATRPRPRPQAVTAAGRRC